MTDKGPIPIRLTKARAMAGLSIAQATRRLGWPRTQPLLDFESGDAVPSDAVLEGLAKLYGVRLAWLAGGPPVLSDDTQRALREAEDRGLTFAARDSLAELLGAIGR